jgi:hypothetical protein
MNMCPVLSEMKHTDSQIDEYELPSEQITCKNSVWLPWCSVLVGTGEVDHQKRSEIAECNESLLTMKTE